MARYGIGQPVRRVEDRRFITGRGRYVDDISLREQAHAVIVFSPHAHARIRGIETARALAAPGVLCVLTGADVMADGLGALPPNYMPEDIGGPKGFRTFRPILATDVVRCVGDRVALVVAETQAEARDAAELLTIDYEPLSAVVDVAAAVQPGAPVVWDGCPDNVSFSLAVGDRTATQAAMTAAAHCVRAALRNNRLMPNPLEVRVTIGDYDAADESFTLYSSSQAPHAVRAVMAHTVFHLPESRFRVISPDVGGGFGLKADAYPEDALVLWASRRCGRPVKWLPTRSEALMSDNHGRDEVVEATMALDANGRILAIQAHSLHNLGCYIVSAGAAPVEYTLRYTPGVYDVQAVWLTAKGVLTNTSPVSVYRGPGRAEGNYVVERLLDLAADEMGIGADEIRRRNVVSAERMPYATATGSIYDSGDFPRMMRTCLGLADWDGYALRAAGSARRGLHRGRSIVYYIEHAGIFNDRMEIRFDPGGTVTVIAGTHSHGQGHATVFAQLVSEFLGVPFETIRFVQGDTDKVAFGRGTYAARSSLVGGVALKGAADRIIEQARQRAAFLFEAAPDDVEFVQGGFRISGTDRSIMLVDIAKSLFQPVALPGQFNLGLEATGTASGDVPNFPNGCHSCEVEIDPETGRVRIDRYVVVDDVGHALNPMICEGQIQGGIAQGIGQALLENALYDQETGQLAAGSFMDYCMPRADDFGSLRTELAFVPSPNNPLGVKGVGESGTIGAPPAVMNAVLDALRPLGVRDLDMPATSSRVWAAMQKAQVAAESKR